MVEYTEKKEYARIMEVKSRGAQENCIRVYCTTYPNGFTFQIRTYKPINEFGNGVNRAMVATVELDIAEMEAILKYMKTYKN